MGIFKRAPVESAADKAMREDIERRKKQELAEKKRKEEEEAYQKTRQAKGLVGSRSMFTRAGGKGYF